MDEWAIDPELHGTDEPYTEVSEFGTVTYQYQDGVRPITKSVMEYVVRVESDSIVYYQEGCPEEWLPEVGGYVSCGCCRQIPQGLCSRVLSVEHRDGLIRVVTTRVPTKDVFKTLQVEMDFDYVSPNVPRHDVRRLDSLGVAWVDGDTLATDYGLLERGLRTRSVTRDGQTGSGEGDKEKDSTYAFKLSFEKEIAAGITAYAEGEIATTDVKHVYYKSDEVNQIYENYTIDRSYSKIDLQLGFKSEHSRNGYELDKFANPTDKKQYQKLLRELKKKNLLGTKNAKPDCPGLKLPLPTPFPCWLVITFDVKAELSLCCYGEVKCTYYHPEKKTGERKVGDVKTKIDEDASNNQDLKSGRVEDASFTMVGQASVSISATLGVGIEFPGVGTGVKMNLSFKTELAFGSEQDLKEDENVPEATEVYHQSWQCELSCHLTVGIEWYLSPLGLKILSVSADLYDKELYAIAVIDGPELTKSKTNLSAYHVVEATRKLVFTPKYNYNKIGTFYKHSSATHYVGLRVYNKERTKHFDLQPKGSYSYVTLEVGKTYEYQFDEDKIKEAFGTLGSREYYMVPIIVNPQYTYTTEMRDLEELSGQGTPDIKVKSFKQVFANQVTYLDDPAAFLMRMDVTSSDKDWSKYWAYSTKAQFELKNTAAIDSWGIRVEMIRCKGKETIFAQDYVLADKAQGQLIKKGLYTFHMEFISNISEYNYSWNNDYYISQLELKVYPFAVVRDDHIQMPSGGILYLESIMKGNEQLGEEENLLKLM